MFWQYFDEFQQKYPQIKLDRKRHITVHERIYCSNGLGSGLDLGIYLVEKLWGQEIALQVEKQLLVGFRRGYANENIDLMGLHYHGDDTILSIQQWMEVNYNQSFDLDAIATRRGLPLQEAARQLLQLMQAGQPVEPKQLLAARNFSLIDSVLEQLGEDAAWETLRAKLPAFVADHEIDLVRAQKGVRAHLSLI